MAKSNPVVFPAGMLIGQALALGILSLNQQVLTGYAPATGLGVAQGGVESIQGPGGAGPVAAVGGGAQVGGQYATIGDNISNNPGYGGVATATGVGGAGNITLQQLLSTGSVQLSDLCSQLTFGQQGGD